MKIYTKTGDAGETSLVGGRRVSKASGRVCAYGDLDELISYMALLRCHIGTEDAVLRQIQATLMTASAHVASQADSFSGRSNIGSGERDRQDERRAASHEELRAALASGQCGTLSCGAVHLPQERALMRRPGG